MLLKHLAHAFVLLCLIPTLATAQTPCPIPPAIEGNLLVCPGEFTVLTTTALPNTTYQWLARKFGSNLTVPIAGATTESLIVGVDELPLYVSVQVFQESCVGQSVEVLVDGIVFLPVTVASTGNFDIGPEGESLICPGDTVFFETLLPYTINHVWYRDNEVIPGANQMVYAAVTEGDYTVSASPEPCPNWTEFLGVTLAVRFKPTGQCTSNAPDAPLSESEFRVFPNPVTTWIGIEMDAPQKVRLQLWDMTGRLVHETTIDGNQRVDVSALAAGTYRLTGRSEQGLLLAQRMVVIGGR
jgi:Secretion system C-terminal sorting domain